MATENAAPGAWGTVIAMLLAIVASVIGGMAGQNQRLAWPGSRAAVTT